MNTDTATKDRKTAEVSESTLNDLLYHIFYLNGKDRICIDKKMLVGKLENLETLVDDFLDSVFAERDNIKDAINWADLSCVDTAIVIDLDCNPRWRVQIEEADPNSQELRKMLFAHLKANGYNDVLIEFEW